MTDAKGLIERLTTEVTALKAENEQHQEIRDDMSLDLSHAARALGVEHEPHQTFRERLHEALHGVEALTAEGASKDAVVTAAIKLRVEWLREESDVTEDYEALETLVEAVNDHLKTRSAPDSGSQESDDGGIGLADAIAQDRLAFELEVAREREAIDDTETKLANRRIKSLKAGLSRAIGELSAWMRSADKGTISASNSADRDAVEYLEAVLEGESLACCDFHDEGGDTHADCWDYDDAPADSSQTNDNPYYGKDCPEGMVQVEFVGCSPNNKRGEYGWKPEKSAFIEVYVDGRRYRIDVGNFHDGRAERRGLHIVGPIDMQAEKTSVNACSVWRGLPASDDSRPTPSVCEWADSEYDWKSGCGKSWDFEYDGPTENGVKFCMNCGKPVVITLVDSEQECDK